MINKIEIELVGKCLCIHSDGEVRDIEKKISDTHLFLASGARASAILYSLIETAKANGLTPFNYLMYLLEELPKKPDDLEYLMLWNVELDQVV